MRALSGHHFVSNLMFGSADPNIRLREKTAPLNGISRTCVNFISDLMFGSEHQIQRSKRTDLITVCTAHPRGLTT
jgi:hypothetical protein